MMTNKTKILFAAGESAPFVTTGGLGEVVGSLPGYLQAENTNYDVRVVIPLYEQIKFRERISYLKKINVRLAWRNQHCKIFTAEENGVTYYFIDNEYYFARPGCYGHFDDGERFAFFCKAVLGILEAVDFFPDIIHAHDWHAAALPVYLKTSHSGKPEFKDIKTVFTIHNMEHQGKFDMDILEDIFDISFFSKNLVDFGGRINLMKGAVVCSDMVTTVSPGYAKEIHTPEYAYGLESVVNMETAKIRGITNGIDYGSYNPATDSAIFANYDSESLENKLENKLRLQEAMDLQPNKDIPLIAMVTRLTKQKGFDLMERAIYELGNMPMQLVIFGDGDYEAKCEYFCSLFPEKIKYRRGYDPAFARLMYAGADMVLMPSEFEPCGLSQMIAARYGTVPLVSGTGGLADTITPYDEKGTGIGFVFGKHDKDGLLGAVAYACGLYKNKEKWQELMLRCMDSDFGWGRSAAEYLKMYGELT
jgi:starch synthase